MLNLNLIQFFFKGFSGNVVIFIYKKLEKKIQFVRNTPNRPGKEKHICCLDKLKM